MSEDPRDAAKALATVRDGIPKLPEIVGAGWSDEQRRLKAQFWLKFKASPMMDEDQITPAVVEQTTGKSIQNWLSNPAFWPWFSSRDTTRQYLEVAAEQAAELMMMYLDPSVPFNDNARVNLIKYVLEFSGRSPPSRKEIKWQDKEIAGLSEDQLDALIAKHTKGKNNKP